MQFNEPSSQDRSMAPPPPSGSFAQSRSSGPGLRTLTGRRSLSTVTTSMSAGSARKFARPEKFDPEGKTRWKEWISRFTSFVATDPDDAKIDILGGYLMGEAHDHFEKHTRRAGICDWEALVAALTTDLAVDPIVEEAAFDALKRKPGQSLRKFFAEFNKMANLLPESRSQRQLIRRLLGAMGKSQERDKAVALHHEHPDWNLLKIQRSLKAWSAQTEACPLSNQAPPAPIRKSLRFQLSSPQQNKNIQEGDDLMDVHPERRENIRRVRSSEKGDSTPEWKKSLPEQTRNLRDSLQKVMDGQRNTSRSIARGFSLQAESFDRMRKEFKTGFLTLADALRNQSRISADQRLPREEQGRGGPIPKTQAGALRPRPREKECSHCGMKGHHVSDCWKLHPEKREEWKKRQQQREEQDRRARNSLLSFRDELPQDHDPRLDFIARDGRSFKMPPNDPWGRFWKQNWKDSDSEEEETRRDTKHNEDNCHQTSSRKARVSHRGQWIEVGPGRGRKSSRRARMQRRARGHPSRDDDRIIPIHPSPFAELASSGPGDMLEETAAETKMGHLQLPLVEINNSHAKNTNLTVHQPIRIINPGAVAHTLLVKHELIKSGGPSHPDQWETSISRVTSASDAPSPGAPQPTPEPISAKSHKRGLEPTPLRKAPMHSLESPAPTTGSSSSSSAPSKKSRALQKPRSSSAHPKVIKMLSAPVPTTKFNSKGEVVKTWTIFGNNNEIFHLDEPPVPVSPRPRLHQTRITSFLTHHDPSVKEEKSPADEGKHWEQQSGQPSKSTVRFRSMNPRHSPCPVFRSRLNRSCVLLSILADSGAEDNFITKAELSKLLEMQPKSVKSVKLTHPVTIRGIDGAAAFQTDERAIISQQLHPLLPPCKISFLVAPNHEEGATMIIGAPEMRRQGFVLDFSVPGTESKTPSIRIHSQGNQVSLSMTSEDGPGSKERQAEQAKSRLASKGMHLMGNSGFDFHPLNLKDEQVPSSSGIFHEATPPQTPV